MPTDEEKKTDLENAIDSGVRSITVGDKTITYRDVDELFRALERIKRKSRPIGGNVAINPYFDKGL